MEQATSSVQKLKLRYYILIGLSFLAALLLYLYLGQYILSTSHQFIDILPEYRVRLGWLILLFFVSLSSISFFVIHPLFKKISQTQNQMQKQQTQDNLTGLPHRQAFQLISKQTLALSQRYHWPLSLIRIDIDHFHSINQTYGQVIGDKVIQHFANTIQAQCRESDYIFRYEGEEFVILLPQTNQQQAITLAKKVLDKVGKVPFCTDKLILELSASGGIAEWVADEPNLEGSLLRAADALKQAKQQGRNRIL